MTAFARHLAGLIRADGPLRLDRFMGLANAQYYATRDPLGAAGDFTTAPEVSQLFGEMIALALVDHWERSGAPDRIRLVELGPGRGTLMADLLRAARVRPGFLAAAHVTLVETSPALRARQAAALAGAERLDWTEAFESVAADAPLYLVANEFFDALPIRQFARVEGRWHERFVGLDDGGAFRFLLSPALAPAESAGGDGIVEVNEPARAVAAAIGARLNRHGGLALAIDYGHARSAPGDTLQAVKAHRFADPLAEPGEADLTAHVDFVALARAAGATAHGPLTQGDWLRALGIEARAAALARARPDRAETLASGLARLIDPSGMGTLFKAMALTGPGGPLPAGFGP